MVPKAPQDPSSSRTMSRDSSVLKTSSSMHHSIMNTAVVAESAPLFQPTSSELSSSSSPHGGFYYLSEDARQQLPLYQYRGSDLSLLYQYVLSPLAAWLVNNVTPKTMAPNTLTTIGLIWMVTAYITYWWYVPTLEIAMGTVNDNDNDAHNMDDNGSSSSSSSSSWSASTLPASALPRWIFLWNCISMLAYQTLDNMDGKQARRTQSSSPLGLLFDHGCDAVNSIFGSANWIIGMALVPAQNLWQCWALVFGPFAMFYIATWEQYYTGELIMPIVNGPNEGLMGGALLSLTSYLYGPEYWQGTDWWTTFVSVIPFLQDITGKGFLLRNCDFVIGASCLGFLQEIVLKSAFVTRQYKGSAAALLPLMALSISFWVIGWMDPSVWLDLPRTSLHLAMVLFVEQVTDLMVAHVTSQPFQPYRWQMVPLLGLVAWVAAFGRGGDDSNSDRAVSLSYWILAYTWGMAAYVTMKCVLLIHEICGVLEIYCFDIVTPYHKKIGATSARATTRSSFSSDPKQD